MKADMAAVGAVEPSEDLPRDQLARLATALARCAASAYQARTQEKTAPGAGTQKPPMRGER
jgi:hypothetical protein